MLNNPVAEFDRQADALRQHISSGVFHAPAEFDQEVAAVRPAIVELAQTAAPRGGNIPVVIVLKQQPFPYAHLVGQLVAKGRAGFIEMTPKVPDDFRDDASLNLPAGTIYVLWDVDTGGDMLNISPADSVAVLAGKGRTPLTMQEGLFAALAVPEILTDRKNFNSIQMPGSRIADDLRVPSIWVSKGAPRLGWCWFGNPHTWLATASAKARIATS